MYTILTSDEYYFTVRTGYARISITTRNELTDDQMQDLNYIAYLMSETGKSLKDLFKRCDDGGV